MVVGLLLIQVREVIATYEGDDALYSLASSKGRDDISRQPEGGGPRAADDVSFIPINVFEDTTEKRRANDD